MAEIFRIGFVGGIHHNIIMPRILRPDMVDVEYSVGLDFLYAEAVEVGAMLMFSATCSRA